jgi:hypothetical protein
MSSFIALQDLCGKSSPRSVAFDKINGGLKLFSDEGSINAFLHVSDYHSSFAVHLISSTGTIIADKFLKFDRDVYPKVNPKNNFCSFGFRLEISSLSCKRFFYLVASWVTNAQTARFLVSGAFAAGARNTIFGQLNEHCSYLSLNYFDSDKVLISTNNNLELSIYLDEITVFARREMQHNYIVHQPQGLSLANHTDAVISAVLDMFRMNLLTDCKNELQLFLTFWMDERRKLFYSQIESFFQSIFHLSNETEAVNTTLRSIIEVDRNNTSILIKEDDQSKVDFHFTLTSARSAKQRQKKKENRWVLFITIILYFVYHTFP